jgi:hypothetical protein
MGLATFWAILSPAHLVPNFEIHECRKNTMIQYTFFKFLGVPEIKFLKYFSVAFAGVRPFLAVSVLHHRVSSRQSSRIFFIQFTNLVPEIFIQFTNLVPEIFIQFANLVTKISSSSRILYLLLLRNTSYSSSSYLVKTRLSQFSF